MADIYLFSQIHPWVAFLISNKSNSRLGIEINSKQAFLACRGLITIKTGECLKLHWIWPRMFLDKRYGRILRIFFWIKDMYRDKKQYLFFVGVLKLLNERHSLSTSRQIIINIIFWKLKGYLSYSLSHQP